MVPGEIYLANFPFGGSPGMKLRPVLLLTGPVGTVPEILVAYISSVIPATPLPSDIILDPRQPEHRTTNLKMISVLRLHKLATIHGSSIVRRLGVVGPVLAVDVLRRVVVISDAFAAVIKIHRQDRAPCDIDRLAEVRRLGAAEQHARLQQFDDAGRGTADLPPRQDLRLGCTT